MSRADVDFPLVCWVRYLDRSRALDVQLRSGRIHRWLDVPPEVYVALQSAPSVERFLADEIEDRYRSTRVA